jgi:transcriptional regulator with XRE-family HTH domain
MNAKEIGQAIKARRRSLGVDQKSVSELSGVAVHTLSNIESGCGNPTVAVLNAITEVLGMDLIVKVADEPQR